MQRPSPPSARRAAARTTVALAAVALAALVLLVVLAPRRTAAAIAATEVGPYECADPIDAAGDPAALARGARRERNDGPTADGADLEARDLTSSPMGPSTRAAVAATRDETGVLVVRAVVADRDTDLDGARLNLAPRGASARFREKTSHTIGPDRCWRIPLSQLTEAHNLELEHEGFWIDTTTVHAGESGVFVLPVHRRASLSVRITETDRTRGARLVVHRGRAPILWETPLPEHWWRSLDGSQRGAVTRFDGLVPGWYALSLLPEDHDTSATDVEPLATAALWIDSGEDAEVELVEGERLADEELSVRLTIEGDPALAAGLIVTPLDGWRQGAQRLESNGTGTFTAPIGDASLVAIQVNWTTDRFVMQEFSDQTVLVETHGRSTTCEIARPTGRVIGRVTAAVPLDAVLMSVHLIGPLGELGSNGWDFEADQWFARTEDDGSFEIDGLPPGRYQATVGWRQLFGYPLHQSDLVVPIGEDAVEFSLTLPFDPRPETRIVRVVDVDGEEVGPWHWELWHGSGEGDRRSWHPNRALKNQETGDLELSCSRARTAVIAAATYEFFGQGAFDTLRPRASLPTPIPAEGPITITMLPAGYVDLRVMAADGSAPALFNCRVRDARGHTDSPLSHGPFLPTDACSLGPLPAGTYVLDVHALDGRVFERRVEVVAGRTTRVALP